jgi:hypothetical protein
LVEKLKEVRNVGELEDSQPAMIVTLDLVVEDHEEADDKAGKSDTTQTDENLLADAHPWRMADAQEDWLVIVNYGRDYGREDLRGQTCGPLGGARWKKTF